MPLMEATAIFIFAFLLNEILVLKYRPYLGSATLSRKAHRNLRYFALYKNAPQKKTQDVLIYFLLFNKIFVRKFSKTVKSKIYHIENSKTRGQTCRSRL